MKRIILAMAMSALVVGAANAKCKPAPHSPLCQVGDTNCEPTCITTSDGGPGADNIYSDDRKRIARERAYRYRAQERWRQQHEDGDYRFMRTREYQQQAAQRGRDSWANDGIKTDRVGTISPFVPGSTEDTAWRAERKRRGIQ